MLAEIVSPSEMLVLPAPSTFSLAAARLGWPLQSTVTLGLHVERLETLLRYLHGGRQILALSLGKETPRQAAELLDRYGFGPSVLRILEQLGGSNERVHKEFAKDVGHDDFGGLNVLAIEVKEGADARAIPMAAGLPDDYFEHDGQITKREIRAMTISALRPAPGELLWDIGLGSGSIAIEWLLSHPAMRAYGFEKSPERAARAARNAASLGVPHLEIVEGAAPSVLTKASTPDAVFVGGGVGRPGVLGAAWAALKPGGRIVSNAVTFAGQAALMECRATLGGKLTRVCVEREHPMNGQLAWKPALAVMQWSASKP